MKNLTRLLAIFTCVFSLGESSPALAVPAVGFQDELLDKLVGDWTATGVIEGAEVRESVQVSWVLGH